ncbi:Uncharacterised protein [uncultured Clostridium sp.]|nr:Uncharacterised protein [uncultured Clostridium sp.]
MALAVFVCGVMAVSLLSGLLFLGSGIYYLHTDKHSAARIYILIGCVLFMLSLGYPMLFMIY